MRLSDVLVRDVYKKRVHKVRVGEQIEDYVVKSITARRVVLAIGEEALELVCEDKIFY